MKKAILLGLDVGTTYVKAAAFLPDGARLAGASRSYPTSFPHPGWAEQSPADWQSAILDSLQRVLISLGDRKDDIAALGLSSHAPGLVPVDSLGVPLLERVPIWQDERSVEQGMKLLDEIGSGWVGLGMPMAAFAAKLRWFTETHPDLARQTSYALGVKAFLAHWLTGRYATDPSSEPGLTGAWEDVCRACGWSSDRLAPVHPASEIIGEVRADLLDELGLKAPIPVVLGLNDGASATLGAGGLIPGDGVITLATNGVIFLVADRAIPADLRLSQAFFCWPYLDDHYIAGGQTKTGGASLGWLIEVIKGRRPGDLDYEGLLGECAGAPPGSHGVTFFPYLMGRGTPVDDPSARGSFIGLTVQTHRSDLGRAVLEGVAFTLRDVLEALGVAGLDINSLRITGGGARSDIWRQIVADVLGRRLSYSTGDSCLGAAILAACGIGLFPDVGAALHAMQGEILLVDPSPETVPVYGRLYGEYCRKRDSIVSTRP